MKSKSENGKHEDENEKRESENRLKVAPGFLMFRSMIQDLPCCLGVIRKLSHFKYENLK